MASHQEQEHDEEEQEAGADGAPRRLASHVRERQRAVAEREASRLARPEARPRSKLGHADRKKSAVTSTPFGVLSKRDSVIQDNDDSWCGPFSVARQMIAQREEAKLKRLRGEEDDGDNRVPHPLDGAVKEIEMEELKKTHPSLQWKGTVSKDKLSGYAKRQKRAAALVEPVPSLFDLCVDFLVQNFDYVESLGDVDSSIRTAVSKALVARGKLNNDSFHSIAETGIEALELVDCSGITQEQLKRSLTNLLPAGLKYLVLDQAGRCFGAKVVETIVQARAKQLRAFSLGGAYLLTDDSAASLVQSIAATVTSLEFKACPILGNAFCKSIGDSYASTGNLLELTLEDIPLTADHFQLLAQQPDSLNTVKNLSLQRLPALSDELLDKLLAITGPRLEGLDLTGDYELTDSALGSIRQHCPRLQNLNLTGLRLLTAEGLEALFMPVVDNPPPMLRRLILNQCDHEAVTDDVVTLIAQASTRKRTAEDSSLLLGGLKQFEIQGSTLVSDKSLEQLAGFCSGTLQELNVSFCPKITSQGLGYLVDKVGRQLNKLHLWGLAQIDEEFLDGHTRINDRLLQIRGAWMKKHLATTM